MSYLITPFEVSAKALPAPVHCRFVHLFPAISTRHSDTIDCWFRVNGQRVTVAVSCPALASLRQHDGKVLADQRLAEIAAFYLRRTLEKGYDPTQAELFIGYELLKSLASELGFL
jgi:hypothetical protein